MTIRRYPIHKVSEYINWLYFFHAWGFKPVFAQIVQVHECAACRTQWINSFEEENRGKAMEAVQLFKDAHHLLNELDRKEYYTQGIFMLADANSNGDNLLLNDVVLPLLRQQQKESEYLCLSDFVRPLAHNIKDEVGVFATTSGTNIESLYKDDPYKHMIAQTLADRLAEATADLLHQEVRTKLWGYAPDEHLSITELHQEKYQGIRPAVGYPSLPDQSVNFILDELIDMKQIGITLTENGMMLPHASVSGLMIKHPKAHYFAIGKIGEDQLLNYAMRRGLNVEQTKKYLVSNII